MAKISLVLDTRSVKSNRKFPLKIMVASMGQSAFIPLDIDLLPTEWDSKSKAVIGRADKTSLNLRICSVMKEYESRLSVMDTKGRKATDIRDELIRKSGNPTFEKGIVKYIESCRTDGNRKVYRMTLNCLRKFDKDLSSRSYEDINGDYLERLDRFLSSSWKTNSRSIVMRCIRAIFNRAIGEGLTESYPFRRFKIRQEETRKRNLTVNELRTLRDMKFDGYDKYQEIYRDIFFLMLYLIGINAADLFQAKWTDITDGRLFYHRQKTHRAYSIKLEPEALAIIEKYKGRKYLLNLSEKYKDYRDCLHHMNDALKQIGRKVGKRGKALSQGLFPQLSTYWARHSWATLAYELEIPVDVIGQALGHSDGSHAVTMIYIRPDQRKVDKANRRVIDYILGCSGGKT